MICQLLFYFIIQIGLYLDRTDRYTLTEPTAFSTCFITKLIFYVNQGGYFVNVEGGEIPHSRSCMQEPFEGPAC